MRFLKFICPGLIVAFSVSANSANFVKEPSFEAKTKVETLQLKKTKGTWVLSHKKNGKAIYNKSFVGVDSVVKIESLFTKLRNQFLELEQRKQPSKCSKLEIKINGVLSKNLNFCRQTQQAVFIKAMIEREFKEASQMIENQD